MLFFPIYTGPFISTPISIIAFLSVIIGPPEASSTVPADILASSIIILSSSINTHDGCKAPFLQ